MDQTNNQIKDFIGEVKDRLESDLGKFDLLEEEGKIKIQGENGVKYRLTLEGETLELHPEDEHASRGLVNIVPEILEHFWKKAERELERFSKRTNYKTELILYLTNEDGETYVATRDKTEGLRIVPAARFLEE